MNNFTFAIYIMGALTAGCAVGILIMGLCTIGKITDDYAEGFNDGYAFRDKEVEK